MLNQIVSNAPVFLMVAARCFALIMTLPLFSSRTISRRAKVAFAGCLAFLLFPQMSLNNGVFADYKKFFSPYNTITLDYIFLVLGEAMIGVIMGFFVTLIFAAFSTAGQFFAFQMGFSASEVYDAMNEVENPLMGQYLNFIAMILFLQNGKFVVLFTDTLSASFKALNVFSIISHRQDFLDFTLSGLTLLFKNALIIALPLMGTLFLINVCMGMLSKAAPQMNLLAEGFPILILTSFFLLTLLLPDLGVLFRDVFNKGLVTLEELFTKMSGGGIE